ncbi:MAG TPA: DUF3558 domain-containing protein [Aldersonia sp.]
MNSLVGAGRGLRVVGTACIVFAVVGCGSETVVGTPTAATQAGQPAFDPCLLPDEALMAAGADPATKDHDFFGVRMDGWNLCAWTADWYFLSVFATTHSIAEVRANPNNTDFAPAVVDNRDAFTYHEVSDTDREFCDVAFASTDGTILIRVDTQGGLDPVEDPCVVATRSANALDPYLPQP